MATYQYDPAQVIVALGGTTISGYADGTFVEVAFDERQWNKVTGADGATQRSKTNNYTGTITLTLLNGAASNDFLSSLWNRDRQSNSGAVGLLIKDLSGRTIWQARNAWVQQMPNQGFSKNAENREWVIDCDALNGQAGGNLQL